MKRRQFLKGATLGATLPGLFGSYGVEALTLSPWLKTLANATIDTDRVLVIIRLNGGNDGINMVVPLDQYGNLSTARGNLLLREQEVLRLPNYWETGLHPVMTGLRDLYKEGKLHIVQGVAYPNQNFSHFRSTDIYMSASNANEQIPTGWIGRYLNTEYPNFPLGYPNTTMPDPLAIQISEMTLTFQGPSSVMGVTVSNPSAPYDFLDDPGNVVRGNVGDELTYLRTVAKQADKYGQGIKVAYERAKNLVPYPTPNSLADQLKIVARLIAGGLKTRVYMVQLGGFDTHANQVSTSNRSTGAHANLLKVVSDAVTAFQRDLEALRLDQRVIGMTFSEFGRRIRSNASVGTDHGSGYPMFLFGSQVAGGMTGRNPEIAANTPVSANVPMQYDFRSVYASVLKNWFCVSDAALRTSLLRTYQTLPLLRPLDCLPNTVQERNAQAGLQMFTVYPNPCDAYTQLDCTVTEDLTLLQVFDAEGRLLTTLLDGYYPSGAQKVYFDTSMLPMGTYYARLQTGTDAQVKALVKVR